MSNDFLVKIKETEQKALEAIENALKKKNSELLKYKQELIKKREKSYNLAQEKIKNEIHKSKLDCRKDYEERIAVGCNTANELKSEKINKIESLLPEAEKFLLELI